MGMYVRICTTIANILRIDNEHRPLFSFYIKDIYYSNSFICASGASSTSVEVGFLIIDARETHKGF